ncbi:MAG: iron-containing alcohol dehydrogenase, partial [Aquincola sp.]|nr:iron-containing alcohol dehydrogenase [Aquincola sp.]
MISELISDMVRNAGVASLPAIKRAAGAVTRLVPIPQPFVLVGPGSAARLGQAIADFGHRRLLLVTDTVITRLGLMAPLTEALREAGTPFVVFDAITPDAPIPVIEEGLELYRAEGCDAIVAFGGGSVMDAAKVIALAAANHKRPRELAGYFRGLHGPAPIYAVPTTAGTGSEVTVAAIISDPGLGRKYMVADTRIVPDMAALDPTLMIGLPAAVTAATGMDALTHAIEAFISEWATPYTDRMALAAASMIWQHLPRVVRDGSDLVSREKMALASTYAGLAFTRANVGNVHAIAHQLGGRYHVPHGQANAIMLPPVLRWCLPDAAPRLARLAERVGLRSNGDRATAEKLVDAVQALNDALSMPRTLDALREDDIPELARAACHEADMNYPVPRRMSRADCETLLRSVLPGAPQAAAKK